MVDILWLTYSIWIPHPQPMEIGYSIIIFNGIFLLNSYCWHCVFLKKKNTTDLPNFLTLCPSLWSLISLSPGSPSASLITHSWFHFCASKHLLSPKWGNFTSFQRWIFDSMSLIHASMFTSNPVASDVATARQCLPDQTLPTLTF